MYNEKQSLLDKWNRKFGRFAIHRLMTVIVCGMAVLAILDIYLSAAKDVSLIPYLIFDRDAIFSGQVWRILSFLLIPPESSPVLMVLALYFYWLIGNGLESQWGAFRFNVFYFCGVIGSILAGLITGYATNGFLNLSLFLAFALIYPDYEVLLFFVLPVKVKFLAILDALLLAAILVFSGWRMKVALLIAIGNLFLFFWREAKERFDLLRRRHKFHKDTNGYWKNK